MEQLPWSFRGKGLTLFLWPEPWSSIRWKRQRQSEVLELLESLEGTYGGNSLLYYPVPDYRYPAAVYSDAYLPENGEVTNISARLDGPGLTFGSEEQAMAMSCRNGVFSSFANSFLGAYRRGQS